MTDLEVKVWYWLKSEVWWMYLRFFGFVFVGLKKMSGGFKERVHSEKLGTSAKPWKVLMPLKLLSIMSHYDIFFTKNMDFMWQTDIKWSINVWWHKKICMFCIFLPNKNLGLIVCINFWIWCPHSLNTEHCCISNKKNNIYLKQKLNDVQFIPSKFLQRFVDSCGDNVGRKNQSVLQ